MLQKLRDNEREKVAYRVLRERWYRRYRYQCSGSARIRNYLVQGSGYNINSNLALDPDPPLFHPKLKRFQPICVFI